MLAQIVTRRAVSVFMLGVLVVSTAGCAGESREAAPTDEPATSATTTDTEPTSPTPAEDPDAWKTQFSPAQLEAYDAALRRWESYESRSEPIWAKGQATPIAERLFKEFFPHPTWTSYWERLQGYEQVDAKISGTPAVLWSKAASVSKSGSSVQIQQCVDYTEVIATQRGVAVERPTPKPQRRMIHLSRPEGYDWLIYGVVELVQGRPRPCTP